jgi:hypothetical protein
LLCRCRFPLKQRARNDRTALTLQRPVDTRRSVCIAPTKILTAARKCVKIGTSLNVPEDKMEQVVFVFSRCNALMLMLAAIVAYRAMDRYGLYALGRRRVF